MFEATTYLEKRNALNEIALMQLMGLFEATIDTETQRGKLVASRLQAFRIQYGRGLQVITDDEAARILGPAPEVTEDTADRAHILNTLIANLGRTYFGVNDHTQAPAGAIGTAEFSVKFKDWVAGLTDLDTVLLNPATGFYSDTTAVPGQTVPVLVIRKDDVVYHVVYHGGLGLHELHLEHLPEAAKKGDGNFMRLRSELISYRNSLTKAEFDAALADAISVHTDAPFQTYVAPVAEEVVEEAAAE